MRALRPAVVFAALVLASSCGGGSPAAPSPTMASIAVRFATEPIVPVPVGETVSGPEVPVRWTFGFDLELQESAGIGASVSRIAYVFRDQSGAQIGETDEPFPVRVEARSKVTIRLYFTTAGRHVLRPQGTMRATVTYTDDRQHELTSTAETTI